MGRCAVRGPSEDFEQKRIPVTHRSVGRAPHAAITLAAHAAEGEMCSWVQQNLVQHV